MADKFEKCSADTVKRFKDFVKRRADIQIEFSISRNAGELASATLIRYDYEEADRDKQEPDEASMDIYGGTVPGDQIPLLNLFVNGQDEIEYGGDADPFALPTDSLVNDILDTTEQLEAAGRVTPPVPNS